MPRSLKTISIALALTLLAPSQGHPLHEKIARFEIEGPWNMNTPVHETLTLSSLMSSKFTTTSTWSVDNAPLNIKEFFRGDIWNDDPMCELFDDKANDNWDFSSGITWYQKFSSAENGAYDETNLIGRSHYWDLQFLHSMGSSIGESPNETRAKIMLWLEVFYKLSIGQGITGSTLISNVAISSAVNASTSYTLGSFFTSTSFPTRTSSLATLLTCDTIYTGVLIQRRAIGACMHMLQDSFAKGHTRRTLLNPGDLKPGETVEFQDGKYAQLGGVENFHSYKGQGSAHGDADHWSIWWPSMNPANAASFNLLWGARVAQQKGTTLLNYWNTGTTWENGVRDWFLTQVYNFEANITPSDNSV